MHCAVKSTRNMPPKKAAATKAASKTPDAKGLTRSDKSSTAGTQTSSPLKHNVSEVNGEIFSVHSLLSSVSLCG